MKGLSWSRTLQASPGWMVHPPAASLLTALLIGLTAGCSRAPRPPGDMQSLKVGIQDNAVTALIMLAKAEGLFAAEGLDVQIVRYPSGKLALQAMLGGDVDIATSADMPIMSQSFQRDDFSVVGTIAGADNGAWIIARRDKGIEKAEDLRGKRIATQQNSAVHFFLSMFLLFHYIGESEVELVFMDAVDLPAALVNGEIDAFSMRNPFTATARQLLGENAVEFFGHDVYHQTFNLVAKREWIEANAEPLRMLLRAVARAEGIFHRDPDGASVRAAREYGEDRVPAILADWDRYDFSLSLGQALILTLEDQARWRLERLEDAGADMPNFLDYVDTAPLKSAKPGAVTLVK